MLTFLHDRLANTVILFSLAAGLWGLVAYFRRRGVTANHWGILIIGEILYAAQGLLGISLWLAGERPARTIHLLYGAVALISLPAFYAASKGRDDRRAALIYGLLGLFLAGIGARAMSTGVGP